MRNDNFIDSGTAGSPDDDDYEDDADSLWRKGKNGKFRPAVVKKGEMPIFLIVIGVGILVAVGALLLFDFGDSDDGSKVLLLENKVAQLEARIVALESVSGESKAALANAQELKKVRARFDRLESSLTSRLDHMARDISRIEKRPKAAAPPTKPAAAVKPDTGKLSGKMHTVAKGDTLYSISRNYGLSVDELLSLNNLKKGAVIHSGQKLKVSK